MKYDGQSPLVSIVVVNYNGARLLMECLRSILDFTEYPQYEVVVVDNDSNDDSVDRVTRHFGESEKIKIIRLEKNLGFAEGSNRGYVNSSSRAKYMIFLNNDVTVRRGWLTNLVTVMEEYEDIGVAQPLVFSPDGVGEGFSGGYMDVFGDKGNSCKLGLQPTQAYVECFYAQGAALMVRRGIIREIGLFNPRYLYGYEDTDLCWRSRLAGYKVAVIPSSHVDHRVSATIGGYVASFAAFHMNRNKIHTLLVNYETENLFRYVTWSILSQVVDVIADVLLSITEKDTRRKFHKVCGFGKLNALAYVLTHFPDIWKDRSIVQKRIRKRSDGEIVGKFIEIPRPTVPKSMVAKMKGVNLLKTDKVIHGTEWQC